MFGNLGEMAGLMKKFGEIQKNMKKMKQELAETVLTGKDPTEKVSVELGGDLAVKGVHIDPSLLSSGDAPMVETACASALQNALRQFKEVSAAKLSEATGGLSLPGLM